MRFWLSFAMFFPYLHFLKVLWVIPINMAQTLKKNTWKVHGRTPMYLSWRLTNRHLYGVASRLAIYFHYGVITVHIRLKTTSYCCWTGVWPALNRRVGFSPRETRGDLGLKRGQTAVGPGWVFQHWQWWVLWRFPRAAPSLSNFYFGAVFLLETYGCFRK